jgi:pimeloyl-ACP methyl ester carboxylesterase
LLSNANKDLRNHGDSPHQQTHSYPALAADVEHFIRQKSLGPSILIGHSMGAKAAMALSLTNPQIVRSLIAVDNAPIDNALHSSFRRYIDGMKEIERKNVKSSKEAYAIMANYERSLAIQQFLLSNLRKDNETGHYSFRFPLDILGSALGSLGDFPYVPDEYRYTGPTLFIRGTESR